MTAWVSIDVRFGPLQGESRQSSDSRGLIYGVFRTPVESSLSYAATSRSGVRVQAGADSDSDRVEREADVLGVGVECVGIVYAIGR